MRRRAALGAVLLLLVPLACADGDGLLPTLTTAPSVPTETSTIAPPPTDTRGDTDADDGAAGAGDPYFPTLGNGGYDVTRYDVDLTFDTAPGGELHAGVVVEAVATQDLDTFHLDFGRPDGPLPFTIDTVEVDGEAAPFDQHGEELVVDPGPLVREGAGFDVLVRYRGRPSPVPDALLGELGWQRIGDVVFVSDEPGGAHSWLPVNDHPSDKAAWRLTITVPEGDTAVASGVLTSRESNEGWTTWTWEHADPIPTYVVALAIGELTIVESDGPHGIHIRHAFPPSLADRATTVFSTTAQMIEDLETIFGPYPFDSYGVLVVDGRLGYAMENQTLSLFPASILSGSPDATRTIVHELAHHWVGNWVSPATWDEIWLNEGFATYAEHLWLEHTRPDYDIDAAMRVVASESYGPIGDTGASGMFSPAVYQRGALALHALRGAMGDAGFFQLLRAWPDRFGGRTATTDDLAALASEIAGEDLRPLVSAWVDGSPMPELPR